ncbi:MAG: uracil-DNA glycosylase family protein, partial [Flavobacteriaceae bacterium]
MFLHTHPYEPFIFAKATKLIVGTLPPPRFTTGELKDGDVDFCYGSRDGQLWRILDRIFNIGLKFERTEFAVEQRKDFLRQRKIGICDIVASAERKKLDATDLGMSNIILRDFIAILYKYPRVNTLLFTGGNSKNGPEYFFRRHLKEYGLKLIPVSTETPRIHVVKLPVKYMHRNSELKKYSKGKSQSGDRIIKTVSLTAPSGSANRAIGSMEEYQAIKRGLPNFN